MSEQEWRKEYAHGFCYLVWDGIRYLLPEPLIDEILRDHELASRGGTYDELEVTGAFADLEDDIKAAEAERDQWEDLVDGELVAFMAGLQSNLERTAPNGSALVFVRKWLARYDALKAEAE